MSPEAFQTKLQQTVQSKDLSLQLVEAAKMRNILAHGYEDIDPAKLHKSIDVLLEAIPRFIREIEKI